MAKKIGIVGFYRNDMFGVHPDYLHFVEQFGSPVIIPPVSRKDFFRNFKVEGLVLPGGADVDPARYSNNRLQYLVRQRWFCQGEDPILEHFDREILPGLFHAGFPVFGICRGLQTLNVHFGGTLRNVDWHPKSISKTDAVHEVVFNSGRKTKVNSFHHQAIGRLANAFNIVASSTDGIAEIITHKELPIAAVQYHPERMEDEWSISACRRLFA